MTGPASRAHAICVGVLNFEPAHPVASAEADAARLHRRLLARGVRSHLLVGPRACKEKIASTIHRIGREANPGEQLIFYFSGHGGQEPIPGVGARRLSQYLGLHGTERLTNRQLAALLAPLFSLRLLLVLDACSSEGMWSEPDGLGGVRPKHAPPVHLVASSGVGRSDTTWGDEGSHFTVEFVECVEALPGPAPFGQLSRALEERFKARTGRRLISRAHPESGVDAMVSLGVAPRAIENGSIQAHVLSDLPRFSHYGLLFFRAEPGASLKESIRGLGIAPTSDSIVRSESAGLRVAYGVSFTYRGLQELGAPDLHRLPQGDAEPRYRADVAERFGGTIPAALGPEKAFEVGARRRSDTVTNNPRQGVGSTSQWRFGNSFPSEPHGLVIVGVPDASLLGGEIQRVCSAAPALSWHVETGYRPHEKREAFGFVDGLAKPGIAARLGASSGEASSLVPRDATSVHSPETLLVAARADQGDWWENGSFLVYQRLNQDRQAFRESLAEAARQLRVSVEQMAAYVMGRTFDGAPICHRYVRHRESESSPQELRNHECDAFDFGAGGCPAFAHIRRANPRLESDAPVPLYRRSLRFFSDAAVGRAEEGLHFLCYQSSIGEQYEAVMRWLAKGVDARGRGPLDTLLGRSRKAPYPTVRSFEIGGVAFPLREFVYTSGGAYLFAPTLPGYAALLS